MYKIVILNIKKKKNKKQNIFVKKYKPNSMQIKSFNFF